MNTGTVTMVLSVIPSLEVPGNQMGPKVIGQMRMKIWAPDILGEDRDDVLFTLRQASTKGVALKSSSSMARCRMVL